MTDLITKKQNRLDIVKSRDLRLHPTKNLFIILKHYTYILYLLFNYKFFTYYTTFISNLKVEALTNILLLEGRNFEEFENHWFKPSMVENV